MSHIDPVIVSGSERLLRLKRARLDDDLHSGDHVLVETARGWNSGHLGGTRRVKIGKKWLDSNLFIGYPNGTTFEMATDGSFRVKPSASVTSASTTVTEHTSLFLLLTSRYPYDFE